MNHKIAIASDHAGVEEKKALQELLTAQGYTVIDCGTGSAAVAVDYPEVAAKLCRTVLAEKIPGVIFCGSGIGVSIAANKVKGIRAALCHNELTARLARQHNDANVLALGARILGRELIAAIVTDFLAASYGGEERHARRIAELEALESGEL
jgi:ribose 5-phosphate isomerase B